jgi:hypothetical protein
MALTNTCLWGEGGHLASPCITSMADPPNGWLVFWTSRAIDRTSLDDRRGGGGRGARYGKISIWQSWHTTAIVGSAFQGIVDRMTSMLANSYFCNGQRWLGPRIREKDSSHGSCLQVAKTSGVPLSVQTFLQSQIIHFTMLLFGGL